MNWIYNKNHLTNIQSPKIFQMQINEIDMKVSNKSIDELNI